MNNPNASSLFHYTSSLDILKSIIRDGLLFSYSYEEHDFGNIQKKDLPNFKGIAIPLISFCNTPLSRAENHARVYGKFHIAIDREFLLETLGPILNPVIYYSSENLARSIFCLTKTNDILQGLFLEPIFNLYRSSKEQAQEIVNILASKHRIDSKLDKLPYDIKNGIISYNNFSFASNFILGLSKPIFGLNKLGEKTYLDEEREWRAFMIDQFNDTIRWKFYTDQCDFAKDKDYLNSLILECKDSHITLPSVEWANMITSICVEYESQVPELVNYILSSQTLLGCAFSKETEYVKSFVLSRITSFERLSNDL